MKAPEICNSDRKRLHCRCFPENFPKCLRITLQNTPRRLLLDILIHLTTFFFCPSSELIETRPFIFADIVYHGFHELCIWKTLRNKRPIEAAVRLCFSEQVFLNVSQISQVFSSYLFLQITTGGCFLTQLLLHRKTHYYSD